MTPHIPPAPHPSASSADDPAMPPIAESSAPSIFVTNHRTGVVTACEFIPAWRLAVRGKQRGWKEIERRRAGIKPRQLRERAA